MARKIKSSAEQSELSRLRSDLHNALNDRDAARAATAAQVRAAVKQAYDTGYRDGRKEGIFVALCPLVPGHAQAVAEFNERRPRR